MVGWIKLHRSLKDWEWYHDANATRLLIHLLVSVNYEPKKWKGIDIQAGQLITSYDNLGKDLKMTKQQIRTALKKCESSKEITRERTRDCLHISLVKWDEMQNDQPELNTKNNPSLTREQPELNPSLTPTKEGKKEITKKDKKEKPQTPKGDSFDFDKLLTFFNETFDKKSRIINDATRKKYNARLKDGYTKKDIQNAMINASKSDFHKQNNYQHCTLEFFSRAEKIDKFINFKGNGTQQNTRSNSARSTHQQRQDYD